MLKEQEIICILPAGRQWFIRSALISSLPDDLINDTVAQFADTPVGCSTSFPCTLASNLTDYDLSKLGCLSLLEVL